MIEAVVRPTGVYSLKLTARSDSWQSRLPDGRWASAIQLADGAVAVHASCEHALEEARFVLALDDDTTEFHRRFARDPVLGPTVRALRGLRPKRKATVAHATLRGIAGQLVQSSRALEIERAVIRACGDDPPTRDSLARLSPAELVRCGLSGSRAATLTRLTRTLDLEKLMVTPDTALLRLGPASAQRCEKLHEAEVGDESCVVAPEPLQRDDPHGPSADAPLTA